MNQLIDNFADKFFDTGNKMLTIGTESFNASLNYMMGAYKYLNEFSDPFMTALKSFNCLEKEKLTQTPVWETAKDYCELIQFNNQVAQKGLNSTLSLMSQYHLNESEKAFSAWLNTIFRNDGEDITAYTTEKSKLLDWLVKSYPKAIKDIEPEYGFHFDDGGYEKVAETDRMILYQVLPLDKKLKVKNKSKPIIIVPPYVLGANILCFLPGLGKSYVHAYANEGIPTYIRIMKNIETTPAVQTMTGEDDALDTSIFCKAVKKRHGKKVTLNGFCQGGYITLINILSGKLDNLVDTLITCVAPIDGTRSLSLKEYLGHIPPRFRDLGYAVKTLPNGNQVVDGKVMSWVYKLKSMEKEAPLYTFYNDMIRFSESNDNIMAVNDTAAAINYWLLYDRTDLPVNITKLSFDSYTTPISKDGTLPVTLFNKKLNIKRLQEKGIKYLICYAERDELVDRDAALASLDYVDAETTPFPKGHGAIATSWSLSSSKCSLNRCFGDNHRGPVRFHLDQNGTP